MAWRTWLFSAKLAWRKTALRFFAIATILFVAGVSSYYVWSAVPAARRSGTAVIHYNIYLGIDDVRSWPWLLLLPGVWILCACGGLIWGFASYQQDPHLSMSLFAFTFFSSLPWIAVLFYLALFNQ